MELDRFARFISTSTQIADLVASPVLNYPCRQAWLVLSVNWLLIHRSMHYASAEHFGPCTKTVLHTSS
jgi:hypothetical protein